MLRMMVAETLQKSNYDQKSLKIAFVTLHKMN